MSDDSAGLSPVRTGAAATEAQAWTEVIHAGAAALVAGTIGDLAIAVDDEIPTFGHRPARDWHGHLDPDRVSHELTELVADTIHDLASSLRPRPTQHTPDRDRLHRATPRSHGDGHRQGPECRAC